MPVSTSADITVEYLSGKTLADLLDTSDTEGEAYVEEFLAAALETAGDFLETLRKRPDDLPLIEYDPFKSGVAYDPYHGDGEALIIGGPRGILQGGYQTLRDHGLIEHESLLNILTKGLVHSYNQQLVDQHFEMQAGTVDHTDTAGIKLYDKYRMLVPPVDEGFAQLYSLHVDGDITDAELRAEYIEAWVDWYHDMVAGFDVNLFRAVALTLSDRAEEVDGDAEATITHMMRVQEPLIRNADVSIISSRLDVAL